MVLERPTWEWVESGSTAGEDPSADVAAFNDWRVRPRVLVDVSEVELTVSTVTGSALPVMISPLGLQRTLHPDGEVALARAAAAYGAVMVVSANTSTPIDEIAAAAPDAMLWYQLANWSDRDSTVELVDRLSSAGVRALVPLVNGPVGAAHVSAQAGFRLAPGVAPVHAPAAPGLDPSLTAEYLRWLAGLSNLPLIPKGVMHADDARRAVDAGAQGIIVSTHGCRQLPRTIGALEALPAIVEAVGAEVDVFLDGGVRTGTDVLVALALGARAVLVGRPMAWALAVGGEAGVGRALAVLREELVEASALSGVTAVRDVSRELLTPAPRRG